MDPNKKVFLVTLQYRAYVVAEDDYNAEDLAHLVPEDERPSVEVEEVRSNVLSWPLHACVYHEEQMDHDIMISDIFPAS
jgi:hypothetical protein